MTRSRLGRASNASGMPTSNASGTPTSAPSGLHRVGFSPLKPLLAAGAVLGVLAMALLAVVTLGLALLIPGARRRVRVFRSGSIPPQPAPSPVTPGATPDPASAGTGSDRPRSYAEVLEVWPLLLAASLLIPAVAQAKLLVPMDDAQANHLKAYGLTFWVLERGAKCEWLLNYRGGSFLLPEDVATIREADLRGVTSEPVVLFSATVTGHFAGSVMMKTANRKSFQIEVNCQIAATTKAGAETGSTTDQNVRSMPARSIRAASISSSGIVA